MLFRLDSRSLPVFLLLASLALISAFPVSAAAQGRSLYMPAIQAFDTDSSLSLVNPGNAAASVTLVAHGYDGSILRGSISNSVTLNLPPQNSTTVRPKELFGE